MTSHPALAALIAVLATDALAQDTRPFTDDLGREVEVPAEPQRIVTLWDGFLTVPLLELGVTPAGSQGRGTSAEAATIRGARLLLGTDFADGEIAWVGDWPGDVERIAAASPDLIITAPWMPLDPEDLQRIAPTVSIDPSSQPTRETYAELAELTGTEDRLARLEAQYQAQLERLRRVVPGDLTVSTLFFTGPGEIAADVGESNIARVLADLGLAQPDAIVAAAGTEPTYSAETLQELDADVILSIVYTDDGLTPADHVAFGEAAIPGWCGALHACRTGQMVYLPVEEAYSASYAALGRVTTTMLAVLSRPGLQRKPD